LCSTFSTLASQAAGSPSHGSPKDPNHCPGNNPNIALAHQHFEIDFPESKSVHIHWYLNPSEAVVLAHLL
jgi:hypothetical protein